MEQKKYSTPGVYVNEIPTANSVVAVATAIPIFIGYTQTIPPNDGLRMISSMTEFELLYGKAPVPAFSVTPDKSGNGCFIQGAFYSIANKAFNFYLYNSLRLFFANGGGTCYIVSIGTYSDAVALSAFNSGLQKALALPDGTMLLFPDALLLSKTDYYSFVNATIESCNQTQNKISLIDIYEGSNPQLIGTPENTSIEDFRTLTLTGDGLSYGVAYYPWIKANIITGAEINCLNFSIDELTACLTALPDPAVSAALAAIKTAEQEYEQAADDKAKQQALQAVITANNALLNCSRDYTNLVNWVLDMCNTLPVTPAMAGIYTAVDTSVGVWQAPANQTLQAVTDVCNKITDTTQAILNIDAVKGKSICAIRLFPNMGVTIWGARTLDGNSQDWRYVNVRRTAIMIEQSIKALLQNYMFAANDPNTWSAVQQSINSFLTQIWSAGGLMGSTATAAFSVSVGLGTTMTGDDILNGYMNVSVKVALTHPAEFLVLTFQQQMQTA